MISENTLISELKKIDSALCADRYVICNSYGGHKPLLYKDNCHKDDIFAPSPLTGVGEVWLGHTVKEFEQRSVKKAIVKVNHFKNGLSLRVYPTASVGYITVDDIKTPKKYSLAKKYNFALKIETSKNNYQGVLKIHLSQDKNREDVLFALREVAQVLNFAFGDKKVSTSSQVFRYPSTYNNKDKHKSAEYPHGFIVKNRHTENVFCKRTQKLFEAILSLIQKGNYVKFKSKHSEENKASPVKKKFVLPYIPCITSQEDENFVSLFTDKAKAEHVYYAHAITLVKEQEDKARSNRNITIFQGHMLDRYLATRLKVIGYDKDSIKTIISCCHSSLGDTIRYRYNEANRANGKYTKAKSLAYAEKIINETSTDHVLEP